VYPRVRAQFSNVDIYKANFKPMKTNDVELRHAGFDKADLSHAKTDAP